MKELALVQKPMYHYFIDVQNNSVSISKFWNTGGDPRDAVGSALTFRLEDYKEVAGIVEIFIQKIKDANTK